MKPRIRQGIGAKEVPAREGVGSLFFWLARTGPGRPSPRARPSFLELAQDSGPAGSGSSIAPPVRFSFRPLDATLKRRTVRLIGIVLLVVVFTGYFAFSTFLFSPIEGRYGFDVSTLIPRDVDFFVAKANLAGDFESDLTPSFAADLAETELGAVLLESPEWQQWRDSAGLGDLKVRIAEELGKLPIQVDPLAIFGGRDLAIAGRTAGGGPADARWAIYGRANWMGKLGSSLLNYPGLIGLPKSGIEVASEDGVRSLSGGGLREPVHVVRVKDVLVATNEREFATAALGYEDNKGQDSLGQSARYHDEIAARDQTDQDELEVLVRSKEVAAWMGWPLNVPDANSLNWIEAFLGKLFQVGLAREMAGVMRFNSGLQADLSGSLLTEDMTPLQKRMYRGSDLDTRTLIEEAARRAPSDVGLFATLEMDLGDLVETLFASMEQALVENLRSEVFKPVLGHPTVESLAADLDDTFDDRLMFQVSSNRYATLEEEIPNNGDPVLVWTVALWVKDAQKVRDLLAKLTRNPGRLQLRGAPRSNGSYDPGVYENVVAGGLVVNEFWSMLVPGTGHIATMQGGDVFLISNHYQELSRLAKTLSGRDGAASLADRSEFLGLASSGLPSSTFSMWIDPAQVADDLRAVMKRQAELDVFSRVNMEAEGLRIRKALLAEQFPGEQWGQLSPEVENQINIAAGPLVQEFRDEFRKANLPMVYAEVERKVRYLEGLKAGFTQLRLEPKDFQLAIRVLGNLDKE